jgi:hypothetical protein
MNIGEVEFYASCSRLKSKRTKKRLQQKELEKQLIQQYKRLQQIRSEQMDLGFIDLVPPAQKGWKRFFVVREDVARSADALFFQELLDKINCTQWSIRKDFKVKRKQKGKKVFVARMQLLPTIELYQLRKIKLTEKERTYFNYQLIYHPNSKTWRNVLVFNESWRYVLKIAPNMITQLRIINPALIKEEQEINNYLEKNGLKYKMNKIIDGYVNHNSRWKKYDKMKYRSLFKNEPVTKQLELEKN